ncbi:hypothetical protein ACFQ0D_18895, partial [Micromonospora zhanjiangensis]
VARHRAGADRPDSGADRQTGGARAFSRGLFVAMLVELALVCLFRQNGFAAVLITIPLCALLLRGAVRRVVVAGATAVAIALLTNWLLLPALGVRHSSSIVAFESFFADLAVGYGRDPGSFPAADTAAMAKVAPLELWRTSGDCRAVDPTVWNPSFDRQAAYDQRNQLLAAWTHLATRSPGTVVGMRLCRGAIAWQPISTGRLSRNPGWRAVRTYVARDPAFARSPFAATVRPRPLNRQVRSVADRLNKATAAPEWLLWRGATWAYLSYLVLGLAAWRRRERALLALGTLSLGVQVSTLVLNAAQAARYMAVPMVIGILLLPLLAATRRRTTAPEP